MGLKGLNDQKILVIEIEGGVVQEVFSDNQDLKVILVDWDNIKQGDKIEEFPAHSLSTKQAQQKLADIQREVDQYQIAWAQTQKETEQG